MGGPEIAVAGPRGPKSGRPGPVASTAYFFLSFIVCRCIMVLEWGIGIGWSCGRHTAAERLLLVVGGPSSPPLPFFPHSSPFPFLSRSLTSSLPGFFLLSWVLLLSLFLPLFFLYSLPLPLPSPPVMSLSTPVYLVYPFPFLTHSFHISFFPLLASLCLLTISLSLPALLPYFIASWSHLHPTSASSFHLSRLNVSVVSVSLWQITSVAESLEFELFRQHRQLVTNSYRREARRLVQSLRRNESLRQDVCQHKDCIAHLITELRCGRELANGCKSQGATSEPVDCSWWLFQANDVRYFTYCVTACTVYAHYAVVITPPPDRGAEYCDYRVCVCVFIYVFVCPGSYLRHYTFDLRHFFVHVTYGHGSVLLWRRSDTLHTSSLWKMYFDTSQGCSMLPPTWGAAHMQPWAWL